MEKSINNNGFEYVDLELPSGTLWATCNVGADKPTDFGLYFLWGDTQGYTKGQCSDYKWEKSSKYTNPGATLDLEDDTAHVNMGGDWHIPSPEQIKELRDNTTSKWATLNGVKGMKFSAKNGKSIFIPAAGYAFEDSVRYSGSDCNIWTSMLDTGDADNPNFAFYLYLYSRGINLDSAERYLGFSVRGVIG